jgi:hypothetical protein
LLLEAVLDLVFGSALAGLLADEDSPPLELESPLLEAFAARFEGPE